MSKILLLPLGKLHVRVVQVELLKCNPSSSSYFVGSFGGILLTSFTCGHNLPPLL